MHKTFTAIALISHTDTKKHMNLNNGDNQYFFLYKIAIHAAKHAGCQYTPPSMHLHLVI